MAQMDDAKSTANYNDAVTSKEIQAHVDEFIKNARAKNSGSDNVQLNKMKEKGYEDEILNQFKFMIYRNNAMKYYDNDDFCHRYCIEGRCNYSGCQLLHNCDIMHMINSEKKQHNEDAQLFCLYFLYLKHYHDNASLYLVCGRYYEVHGQTKEDFSKSEKYLLKSLVLDNKHSPAHSQYALLLHFRLFNYDLAEYHYKMALKLKPNSGICNSNYGRFLLGIRQNYNESLKYFDIAIETDPNYSSIRYHRSKALVALKRIEEAGKELGKAFELNKEDNALPHALIFEFKNNIALMEKDAKK